MDTYLWVCLITFLAGLTQGLSGFGSVLLSIPLLAIFLDIKTVIPLTALIGLSMSLILLFHLRPYLDWKKNLSTPDCSDSWHTIGGDFPEKARQDSNSMCSWHSTYCLLSLQSSVEVNWETDSWTLGISLRIYSWLPWRCVWSNGSIRNRIHVSSDLEQRSDQSDPSRFFCYLLCGSRSLPST